MIKMLTGILALMAFSIGLAAAQAPDKAGIQISDPWARATAGAAKTGAAYVTLRNAGAAPDRLVSASTAVAGKVELHTMTMNGDVMQMRQVSSIDVAPGTSVELKPGGFHVMLMDLKAPLKEGQSFPLTLNFEKSGTQTVQIQIRSVGASNDASKSGVGDMNHSGMGK